MDALPVRDDVEIPGWELWFTASLSGGPGGQHANKTNSRVSLHWSVISTTVLDERQRIRVMRRLASRIDNDGVLAVHADDTPSQHRNKEFARERLAALVADALVVRKRRRATRPSRASQRRRVDAKKKRGALKKQRSERFDE
jgi:ribosome-associated protein